MLKIRKEQMDVLRRAQARQSRLALAQELRQKRLAVEADQLLDALGVIDAAGSRSTIRFSNEHVTITSAEERSYRFEANQRGQLAGVMDPSGLRLEFQYDGAGRLAALSRNSQDGYRFAYDGWGKLTTLSYPDGTSLQYVHDAHGHVIRTVGRDGVATHCRYTRQGRLAASIDAKGQETRFEYADFDAPSAIAFPNGDWHAFAFDGDGRLQQMHVNGTEHATCAVDGAAGSVRIRYADGGSVRLRFEGERLVEAVNETCAVRFDYDAQGRLLREDIDGQVVEYLRNEVGALVGLKTPDGEVFRYGLDQDYRVRSITASSWFWQPIEIDYEPHGPASAIRWPNGVALTLANNRLGLPEGLRLATPAGAILVEATFAYDACDRLVREVANGQEAAYRYDGEGRLLAVESANPARSERFELDANGNRIGNGRGATYRYNEIDQLVWAGDWAFRYDGLGNLRDGACPTGPARFSFDGRGQLAAVTTAAGTVRYAYDALGRRVRKQAERVVTRYVWAGQQLLAEITTAGSVTTRRDYLFLPGRPLPLAMRKDGIAYYLHPGRRFETLCMTDAAGGVVWRAEYDAFGRAQAAGSVEQPWRLAGQYHDPETGLHYALARYYDPALGRYLSKDPLFLEGGSSNFYLYCGGDPINRYDPTGAFIIPAILIGAAIGAAVGAGIEWYRQKKKIEAGEQEGYKVGQIVGAGAIGAVVGAIGGGVGAAVESAFAAGVTATVAGGAGVGALSGAASSVTEQCAQAALTGQAINPLTVATEAVKDGVIGAGIGAVTGGVGGVLARRARKGAEDVILESANAYQVHGRKYPGRDQHLDEFSGHSYDISGRAGTAKSQRTTIDADLAEVADYRQLLKDGEIGLAGPNGANRSGPDSITYNPSDDCIYVNDSQIYWTPEPRPSKSTEVPSDWEREAKQAAQQARIGNPEVEKKIQEAAAANRIRRRNHAPRKVAPPPSDSGPYIDIGDDL